MPSHAFDLISTASLLRHLCSLPLGMLVILMNIVAQVEQFRLLVISFMISMFFFRGCINDQLFIVNLVCLVVCLFMSIKSKLYSIFC